MMMGPIDCGADQCQSPGQICCWDKYGIGTGDAESGQCKDSPVSPQDCDSKIEQGGVQTVISCQNEDECPNGQVCCGDVVQFQGGGGQTISYYPAVECRAQCDWPSRTMCNQPGDPICTGGTVCKQSQLLPQGFFVCGMP